MEKRGVEYWWIHKDQAWELEIIPPTDIVIFKDLNALKEGAERKFSAEAQGESFVEDAEDEMNVDAGRYTLQKYKGKGKGVLGNYNFIDWTDLSKQPA